MTTDTAKRFWSHVRMGDGCWEWQGRRSSKGYGQFKLKGNRHRTHRVAYALTYGLFPHELLVCHHCDNPPCVRPDHLFLGTSSDNVADKVAKGRQTRGEAHHVHRTLSEDDVRSIWEQWQQGAEQKALAKAFGITDGMVRRIVRREKWKHVTADLPALREFRPRRRTS